MIEGEMAEASASPKDGTEKNASNASVRTDHSAQNPRSSAPLATPLAGRQASAKSEPEGPKREHSEPSEPSKSRRLNAKDTKAEERPVKDKMKPDTVKPERPTIQKEATKKPDAEERPPAKRKTELKSGRSEKPEVKGETGAKRAKVSSPDTSKRRKGEHPEQTHAEKHGGGKQLKKDLDSLPEVLGKKEQDTKHHEPKVKKEETKKHQVSETKDAEKATMLKETQHKAALEKFQKKHQAKEQAKAKEAERQRLKGISDARELRDARRAKIQEKLLLRQLNLDDEEDLDGLGTCFFVL